VSRTVRLANSGDISEVSRCVRAAYTKYVGRIGKEPAPMREDHAAAIEAGETYVMVEDGELVGTIEVGSERNHLFIRSVAVRPDRQGEGIGRELMAFAEGIAARAGLPEIQLYTNEKMWENLSFYGRLGFVETHRKLDQGYRRIYLRKKVNPGTEVETGMRGVIDGR
jgi:ribosomal protein S18 acetylase RimI-like enzyme